MSDHNKDRRMVASNGNIVRAADMTPSAPRMSVSEATLDISEIWSAIRKGKWIVVATCVLVIAATAVYTFTVAPTYEANSVVLIETQVGMTPGVPTLGTEERALSNELGILQQSLEIARRVAVHIRKLASDNSSLERFPILLSDDGEAVEAATVQDRLLARVRFEAYATQDMIGITAQSTTPEEAALIADSYAEEYQKYSLEASRASMAASRVFLQEQVEKLRRELNDIEDEWEGFAQRKQVLALGEEGERLVEEVANLRVRRDEVHFALEQEKTSLQLLEQQFERVESGLADNLVSDREALTLEAKIGALDQRIAELEVDAGQYYAVNSPDLEGREASIPELAEILKTKEHFEKERGVLTERLITRRSSLVQAGDGQTGQLGFVAQLKGQILEKEMSIQNLQEQISAYDRRLASFDGRLSGLPRQAIEAKQLERKRAIAEQYYTTFVQELQKAMIAEEAELGYVKIIRAAVPPMIPVRPNITQNFLLATLLGLSLGIGLAFLKHATDDRLHQPDELEDHGYNLIGVIPPMNRAIQTVFGGRDEVEVDGRMLSTRLMVLLDPWSPISENYRLARAKLEFAQAATSDKVFLISSPEASDGKTVTAVNLAIALAQSGRRTLLIDADLRRPAVHKYLGMDLGPGLADVLSNPGQPVERCITTSSNLSILRAGSADEPPAELLGSEEMHKLIRYVRTTFEIVLIDSPPVLAVADAVLLASLCDATVLVTAADKTELRALQVTKKTLAAVGARIVGTVLNRFEAKESPGYDYGYNNGYYRDTYTRSASILD